MAVARRGLQCVADGDRSTEISMRRAEPSVTFAPEDQADQPEYSHLIDNSPPSAASL